MEIGEVFFFPPHNPDGKAAFRPTDGAQKYLKENETSPGRCSMATTERVKHVEPTGREPLAILHVIPESTRIRHVYFSRREDELSFSDIPGGFNED